MKALLQDLDTAHEEKLAKAKQPQRVFTLGYGHTFSFTEAEIRELNKLRLKNKLPLIE